MRKSFILLGTLQTFFGFQLSLQAMHRDHPQPFAQPANLKKYVDALPIPSALKPECFIKGIAHYKLVMSQFKQQLHSQLPPSTVWGFNGITPGPLLRTFTGVPICVTYVNSLPSKPLFPTDNPMAQGLPPVRTVVHLHGGLTPPGSDGYPEAWITPGHKVHFFYPNFPPAFFTFYHDHSFAITAQNVYSGLAGYYLLVDPKDARFNLPKGKFEIPLIVQDRAINQDGSLNFDGIRDINLVNGKVWPYLNVEPRKYRFQILNASNSRNYVIKLAGSRPFIQIGTDKGLLPKPILVTKIALVPAERVDIIVDFSHDKGENIVLRGNDPENPATTSPEVMQFRVVLPLSEPDTSSIPAHFNPLVPSKQQLLKHVVKVRDLTLDGPIGPMATFLLDNKPWEAPVTETPRRGTVEIWNLINLGQHLHPIHLHLVKFLILNRTPFDAQAYQQDRDNGTLKPLHDYFTGPPIPPDPSEAGYKDVVRADAGFVTKIIIKVPPFFGGQYVWHCHNLGHEDNDMMRPLTILPPKKNFIPKALGR